MFSIGRTGLSFLIVTILGPAIIVCRAPNDGNTSAPHGLANTGTALPRWMPDLHTRSASWVQARLPQRATGGHDTPMSAKPGLHGQRTAGQERILNAFGKPSLRFEANYGQADTHVKFLARGADHTLFLKRGGAVLRLTRATPQSVRPTYSDDQPLDRAPSKSLTTTTVSMEVVGANLKAAVAGMDELRAKTNYFVGNDPKRWHSNIPSFAKVRYGQIYPNIDLVFYGSENQIENDFVLSPGANLAAIRLRIRGAESLRVNNDGDVVAKVSGGMVSLRRPTVYQASDGVRHFIKSRYVLRDGDDLQFEVGSYDKAKELVIDPVLTYSTYLGGAGNDVATAVAVDATGNAYVTGFTSSADFPTTPGSLEPAFPVPAGQTAFVTKFGPDGTLIYSTFLGGSTGQFNFASNITAGAALKVDTTGNVYIFGDTDVSDFPTVNAFQTLCNQCNANSGSYDLFITKLGSNGSALLYSSYFGGSYADSPGDIAVDNAGLAYLTGSTRSADFPVTPGAVDQICGTDGNCNLDSFGQPLYDSFVAKIDTTKTGAASLAYSTFLGGSNSDTANGIAIDASGAAYIAGSTNSTDFPTTPGSFQSKIPNSGLSAGFVTKINGSGTVIIYSTYLGGTGGDSNYSIAVDSLGDAYVTGWTLSTDFPVTPGAFQTLLPGSSNAFVSKFNSAGTALSYSSFLGGSDFDEGDAIAVDDAGNAYVSGRTGSADFPLANAVQALYGGGFSDVFVSKIDPSGSQLLFSTYLGGSDNDGSIGGPFQKVALGVAVDGQGAVYVTGGTQSPNFPTTSGAFQAALNGSSLDAFITKLSSLPGTSGNPLGTISITTNLSAAAFTVSGPATFSGTGTNATFSNAPVGAYTVSFGMVAGYTTPPRETRTLSAGGTISVLGTYNPIQTPVIEITSNSLDFGSVPIGATKDLTFAVQNVGSGLLTGTASATVPFSVVTGSAFAVKSTQTQIVTVHFAPTAGGSFLQTLSVSSNGGQSSVQVRGSGIQTRRLVYGKVTLNSTALTGTPVLRLSGCLVISQGCPNALRRQELAITDIEGNYFFSTFSPGDYIMPVSSGMLGEVGDTNLGPDGYIFGPEFCQTGSPNPNRRCSGSQTAIVQDFLAVVKPGPLDPQLLLKLPLPSGNWTVATEAGGYTTTGNQVDADPSHTDLSSGFYAIDFAGTCGTPILAAAGGDVVFARPDGSWGNTVVLRHPGNVYTRYAHLHSISALGKSVTQGQVIGLMGSTGLSFGPHVHFQVYSGGFQPTNSQSGTALLRQVRLDTGTVSLRLIEFVARTTYHSTNPRVPRTVSCSK